MLDAWSDIATNKSGRENLTMSRSTLRLLVEEAHSTADELAALKARRCDGCVHWTQHHLGRGECGPLGYWFDADHACNAWEPKS